MLEFLHPFNVHKSVPEQSLVQAIVLISVGEPQAMSNDVPEILSLFKEQLTNQIAAIVQEQSFENSGYGFAYWYFRNIGAMTDIEAKEQICDGGGDLGIDAIEIDDEQVIFYQFKNPIGVDKAFSTGDVDKMISGLELIS